MTKPLFSSGTARGGTNIITMMLSVHPLISLSQDPYLPIFKMFRNQLVYEHGSFGEKFDADSPMDEYYYFENKLSVMRLIQDSNLDRVLDSRRVKELQNSLLNRMKLTVPLLVPTDRSISKSPSMSTHAGDANPPTLTSSRGFLGPVR